MTGEAVPNMMRSRHPYGLPMEPRGPLTVSAYAEDQPWSKTHQVLLFPIALTHYKTCSNSET